MLGNTDEFQGWVEDPESIAREQFLSTLPPEGFEPDDDVPWDIFDQDDIPRVIIDEARITVAIMPPNTDPAQQIDRIHALQRLLNACAGALAAEQLAFADTQVARQRADRVPIRNLGRGIAEQIGYARRLAPGAASRQLGLPRALADRLPQAFALLRDGLISEAQCQILAAKSSHLDETDAAIVDAAMAPRLTGWNLKQTEQAVQHAVYAIDPQGFVDRRGKAEQDRTVWIKPAPDCKATVTALLPVAQGVAVYAALKKAADTRGVGDDRSGKQVMADTLVERITGQTEAHLVPVRVNLTMTADTLLGNGTTPAWLEDFGPISAEHARAILACEHPAAVIQSTDGHQADCPSTGSAGSPPRRAADGPEHSQCDCPPTSLPDGSPPAGPDKHQSAREIKLAKAWIRRILTDPITGIATNLDSKRRTFDGNARTFLNLRDRACRQPFCSAPIRHADHIHPHHRGGPTSIDNGQGLCERGNYVKDMPGWTTSKGSQPGEVITTTPTGHQYRTLPPPQ
ncbi:MAG: DUF222 domain-containing protein, partial [Actinomycetota bacterium]|nr:DUF222 domain-containing protein [Actinomycetota bacterium]